jgi:hypothetical protein
MTASGRIDFKKRKTKPFSYGEKMSKTQVFHTLRIFDAVRGKFVVGQFDTTNVWSLPLIMNGDATMAHETILDFLLEKFPKIDPIVSVVNVAEHKFTDDEGETIVTILYDVKYDGIVEPKAFGDFKVVRWMKPSYLFECQVFNRPTAAVKHIMGKENG